MKYNIPHGSQGYALVPLQETVPPCLLASGDPSPSEADIKVTRDLHRAGQILKIDLLDHIVIGHPANVPPFVSLREQGYFYS